MSKEFKGNEDWIKREEGRIPTKGALAAERASAGLGTSDEDEMPLRDPSPPLAYWTKHLPRKRATG
jgi:hypothetical protein